MKQWSAKAFCPESGTTEMKLHGKLSQTAISSRKLDKEPAGE
jgi:hypothetical protein